MDSVAVFVVWLYVEGVARDQPPDLCRDVVSTVAQTFSYELIGRQVLDWVVRTFDVVRYVSIVGKVHDEPRPRAERHQRRMQQNAQTTAAINALRHRRPQTGLRENEGAGNSAELACSLCIDPWQDLVYDEIGR